MYTSYEIQNRRRNDRRFWRALTASFMAAIIMSFGTFLVLNEADRGRLLAENEKLTTQNQQMETAVSTLSLEIVKLATENSALTLKIGEQDKVLAARVGFLQAVVEAEELLGQAAGLVDTRSFRELVLAQSEVVNEEKKYAANVDAATATISEASSQVRILLDARLTELAPHGISPGIKVQDKTPYDTARRALNDVGGSWVGLYTADIVCNSAAAIACASSEGHITVANRAMGKGYDFLYQVMMHEYAHQIQFLSLEKMFTSPRYLRLFGEHGDKAIEAAADCMAAARTTMAEVGYKYGCTEEQLAWGRTAWDGVW